MWGCAQTDRGWREARTGGSRPISQLSDCARTLYLIIQVVNNLWALKNMWVVWREGAAEGINVMNGDGWGGGGWRDGKEWRTAIWEEGLNKQKKLKKRDEEKTHYANICFITIWKLCKGNQKVGRKNKSLLDFTYFCRLFYAQNCDLCLCTLQGHLMGMKCFLKWTFSFRTVPGITFSHHYGITGTDASHRQRIEEAQWKGDMINVRRQRTRCVPKDCRSPRPDICLSARHRSPPSSLTGMCFCVSVHVWPKSWHC